MHDLAHMFLALVANMASNIDEPVAVVDAIHGLAPSAKIDSLRKSVVPGFYEVVTGAQVTFVSEDGRFLIPGSIHDLVEKVDITEQRMSGLRRDALSKVPQARRIVFAPENPKFTVSVFTDPDCAYCQKLHSQIEQYNRLGIALEYLWFPRAGLNSPSFHKAVSIWCAADRRKAFADARESAAPAAAKCDNPVAEEFDLGQRLGLSGTPSVIAPDGSLIGGYLTPEQMLARLEQR